MRITKWGEYGILCSLYLARKHADGPVGAAEIAETQHIPLQYTQQILQRLRKGNIIKSVRGPKGGYALTNVAEQISLKEVLYAAEGDTFEVICDKHPVYNERCVDKTCGLRTVWKELKVKVDELLGQHTLASVVAQEGSSQSEPCCQLVEGPKQQVAVK